MNLSYHFKVIPELVWVAVTAGIVALAAALNGIDWNAFQADPAGTLAALGLVVGRAAFAALIARFNGSFSLR